MDFDEHTHTIEQFQRDTDERIAELLPGYIRRHRQAILGAVRDAADGRYIIAEDVQVAIWGATKALDELGGGKA